jgi:polysaccharide chain length determinant protein (PEP-CTERM system associated)
VAVAWGTALAGIAAVSVIPDRYEATARIYVDTQTVLKPLMQGLAFQPDTDQQLRMLARTIVSRPNIEELLKRQADAGFKGVDAAHAVDRLIDRIKVDASGGNLYTISFRDTDSRRAQAVVKGLVDLFVDTGTVSEQRDSTEAGKFIDDQIKVYEKKLSDAEGRLKDFKLRNFSVSGVSNQDYFARTSQISDEVTRLKIAYAAAEHSRDALRHELAGEDPHLPADASNGVAAPPSEIDTRIAAQKRELDELLRKYTDQHPDVIAARNAIRQLEAQKAAERAARADGHAGAAATSPIYQQLRVQLAQAEASVASLGTELAAQQQRLDELRATASKVPQAEAELAQLNRDYDVIRRNYEQLVSRREGASLGAKMDQSGQLADFRVIEPPRVAPKPVFPDRAVLTVLAMLGSLALGAAAAYGLALLHPTFSSAHALKEFTRRPVIGTISVYSSADTLAAGQVDLRRIGLAMLAFFVVQAAWIGWAFLHRAALT